MSKIKEYLKLIRVKHYVKNLLIFLPLFFSGLYKDIDKTLICIAGFIFFCLVSSIIYVINDMSDIEKDRLHETKKNRPLASGAISIKSAYAVIFTLVLCCLLLIWVFIFLKGNLYALLLPLLYVIINVLYSKGLKNVVLLDVVILVSGFLIRLFFGGILIDAEVSNWLYLTVMSGAFYMGFGKRRNEFIRNKEKTRKVLKYYNKDFLDKSMYVCLTSTIVFYSMWTVDPVTVGKLGNQLLIWTVPLLMIILFQYSLSVEKGSDGDPVEVLLNSKSLMATVFVYVIAIILIWI